jgi:small subunit ribosomal protein S17
MADSKKKTAQTETVAEAAPVTASVAAPAAAAALTTRRNEKVGIVVSTKMQKTIVVEIEMRKAHPKYKRVMKSNKKFYAHDEQNSARLGDVVRIREARPLSKLKRWSLEEIVRRSTLVEPAPLKDAVVAAK